MMKRNGTRTLSHHVLFIAIVTFCWIIGGIQAIGAAPVKALLTEVQMISSESADQQTTSITFSGGISMHNSFPCVVTFSLPSTFKPGEMTEVDTSSGAPLENGTIEYSKKTENGSTVYSLTLTKSFGFMAHFTVDGTVFDRTTQMGENPIASMMFMPDSDLNTLVIGFESPSADLIGAGTDVQLLGESEDGGEVYGIVYQNTPKGERQTAVVAFASRANRDAALAEQEAKNSNTDAPLYTQQGFWFTIIGIVLAICIMVLIIVLIRRRR
ncbi:MAG: hypothetical protein LBS17_02010 [Actinomycetes bacterium]|jgi:hypothetical protein|nr:hypothetical protein [Actinomycetes bacterium]